MQLREDSKEFTRAEVLAYLRKTTVSEKELLSMTTKKLYQIIYADEPSRFQNNGKTVQSIQIKITAKP